MIDFGPEKYDCKLLINPKSFTLGFDKPIIFDIETDEKDNLVGIGLCQNDNYVYYFTQIDYTLSSILESGEFITHGGKFDLQTLKKWKVDIDANNLLYDTKMMAYVYDCTLGKYGLKRLAEKYLNMKWPSYKEMVGTGKKKITLDKQPIEKVARYCGMDTLATFKLYEYFQTRLSKSQKQYLNEIEMPVFRTTMKMEELGIQVDVPYLRMLDQEFLKEMLQLELKLNIRATQPFNPRSPKQVLQILKQEGIYVKSTDSRRLQEFKSNDMVKDLLAYREVSKLRSTYTDALLKQPTLPRIYSYFNPTRTITGRLASQEPNLQNIPVKTEKGNSIRKAFCAKKDHTLLIADYSQIEYRLFAHFSQDPLLLEIYSRDRDIHDEIANQLGTSRRVGKTLNFASIYGAQAKKIAHTAQISVDDAQIFLDKYWNRLRKAATWITKTKWQANKNKGITTLFNKYIPIQGFYSKDWFEKLHAERQAVNYIIQGSAAEIIKKAMIELDRANLIPCSQVHDELIFEIPDDGNINNLSDKIKLIMENVVKLSVPLKVNIGIGQTWGEAKN